MTALALLLPFACQRAASTPPPPPPPPPPPVVDRPPVVAQPPSSDAVVLTPNEGLGPYSLGMSRGSVRSLAGDGTVRGPNLVELDGFELLFGGDDALVGVRVTLNAASGGVRVGTAVLQNTATYAEVVSAIGPCAAPQVNEGGTVTTCQNGGVIVYQAGPTQVIAIGVARR
jgi:hypothetical protein